MKNQHTLNQRGLNNKTASCAVSNTTENNETAPDGGEKKGTANSNKQKPCQVILGEEVLWFGEQRVNVDRPVKEMGSVWGQRW